MNYEFISYLNRVGSLYRAAENLGVSYAIVAKMRTGERGVSRKTARKILDAYPELSLHRLMYPDVDAA